MKAFNEGRCGVIVEHWAVGREKHANGGLHYHLSIKFSGPRGWHCVWRDMHEDEVTVNFSGNHLYYISMYRYVMKEDKQSVTH